MNGIQDSLFTSAIAVCLFSVGLVREKERRTGRPAAFFVAFLTTVILRFGFELLACHPATPLKALWLGLWMMSSLLVGPCLWLAVRESVDGRSPAWPLLPHREWGAILLGGVCTGPLLGTTNGGVTFADPGHPAGRALSLVIHTGMLLCIGIFAVQVPVYLNRCRHLLLRRPDRRAAAAAGAPTAPAWLHFPLMIVLTSWGVGLLRTFQCATHAPVGFVPFFDLLDVGVTIAGMYLMVRAGAADVLPAPASPAERAQLFLAPAEPKYAKSPLPDDHRRRIRTKLEAALGARALYRDPLLSLRTLGEALKERPHYLSQVINQDLGTSFYEFVNRHRVVEAMRLLRADPDRSILEVAMAVGFNSKSTFNASFRAQTGMTPRDFRLGPAV